MIEYLGLTSHLMIWKMHYPENLRSVLGQIMPLVTFDIVPTDAFYIKTFGFNSDPLSQSFDEMGYGMVEAIFNMGSVFLTIIAFLVIVLIVGTLKYTFQKECNCSDDCRSKIEGFLGG
jgi:hypothetical protein